MKKQISGTVTGRGRYKILATALIFTLLVGACYVPAYASDAPEDAVEITEESPEDPEKTDDADEVRVV